VDRKGIKGRRQREKKGREKGQEKKHASNQNIVQFTTESGSKSSFIVKKCFCSRV